MIFGNVGNVFKTFDKVNSQPIAGTVKSFSAVHDNVGGVLKKLFPDVKPAYMFQISTTNGGGSMGHMTTTTSLSDWQTAEIGYNHQYNKTVSATGSSGVPNVTINSQTATFYVKENCKLKINVLNNAIIKINGIEKTVGTYSVSTSDEIYFYFNIAATSSSSTPVTVSGGINFELISS